MYAHWNLSINPNFKKYSKPTSSFSHNNVEEAITLQKKTKKEEKGAKLAKRMLYNNKN